MESKYARKFLATGWNIGIKDTTLDFGVLHSEIPATGVAIFTKNNFPGNPVIVGKEHARHGKIRTIVVNSKNANVANGPEGLPLSEKTCQVLAEALGIDSNEVLPSSTGVIGRNMPADKILQACREVPKHLNTADFPTFANAIMTTDTREKFVHRELKSGIRITAVAKGAGMIEPQMATMLCYVATDASIKKDDLDRLIRCVAERSLNRVSVDSDTSTSDTFCVIANGASEQVVTFPEEAFSKWMTIQDIWEKQTVSDLGLDQESEEFALALLDVCVTLARKIARDGEGATKLIELSVKEAKSTQQALKIARSIINSPLVKTAIHGADPNWGRLIMAIGKVFDEPIPIENLRIEFGGISLKNDSLELLSKYLQNEQIQIKVFLGVGTESETVWGCDFSKEYVHINASYTT